MVLCPAPCVEKQRPKPRVLHDRPPSPADSRSMCWPRASRNESREILDEGYQRLPETTVCPCFFGYLEGRHATSGRRRLDGLANNL